MGTTADKGAYLNNTKLLLKQKINNLGGNITSETTFREYTNQLQEVYDRLPKTEYQEGSNITLSNTLKGKLDFEDDIVGYGDTSQKSYTGKNLFPRITFSRTINGVTVTANNDGIVTIKGTATEAVNHPIWGAWGSSTTLFTLPAGTYTASGIGTRQQSPRINIVTNGTTSIFITSTTQTLSTDTNVTGIFIWVDAGTTVDTTFKYQIEQGTTATDWEPYVGGIASPNPSYPQEVKVVRGKNRLDDSNLILFANGRYISTIDYLTKGQISIDNTKTYSFIYLNNTIGDMGLYEYDSNNTKSTINSTTYNNGSYKVRVFNLLSTSKTFGFYAGGDDSYTAVSEFLQAKGIMLLEGDYSSQAIPSYLPYNTIEVVERGKNLVSLGESTWTKAGLTGSYDNSKIIVNGTTTGGTNVLEPNYKSLGTFKKGTYVFSTNVLNGSVITNGGATAIYIRNSNDTTHDTLNISGGFNNVNLKDKTFTLTQDTELFLQIYANASNIVYTNYEVGIQIEEGSTSTSYEEYHTPITYPISLGNIELCKIGDYADELLYDVENDKVYKNEAIRKKVLNGGSDENWAYDTTYNRFALTETINDYNITLRTTAICNYYRYGDTSINNYFALSSNGKLALFHAPTNISTLAEWKTWLSTNNLILYYILATAIREEITGTLKDQIKALYYSHSFNGTTIIESNGDLPMIIKVRALKGE